MLALDTIWLGSPGYTLILSSNNTLPLYSTLTGISPALVTTTEYLVGSEETSTYSEDSPTVTLRLLLTGFPYISVIIMVIVRVSPAVSSFLLKVTESFIWSEGFTVNVASLYTDGIPVITTFNVCVPAFVI